MADTSHAGDHHGPSFTSYMAVAAALAVCTAMSFVFNSLARGESISHLTSFLLILGVAIIKATLVILIFMHMKWDWRLLYFLMIPAVIMAMMMTTVLLPDILIGPYKDSEEAFVIAEHQKQ